MKSDSLKESESAAPVVEDSAPTISAAPNATPSGEDRKTEPQADYDHLDAYAVSMLSRPLAERLRAIDREVYIGWPDADAAIDRLSQLLAMDSHPRRPGMLIISDPGMGKTHLVLEAAKLVGLKVGGTTQNPEINAIFIVCVAGIDSLKSFYERIYSTMRIPMPKVPSIITICDLLKKHGVKLLAFDEAQDLEKVRLQTDLVLILMLIKQMTNELCRPILLMGSPEVRDITRSERHLHSRFGKPYRLSEWSTAEELRSFLYPLVAHWPFPEPSPLFDDETLLEVIRMTGGNTERICKSFRAAARKALQAGERYISTARLEKELAAWQGVI